MPCQPVSDQSVGILVQKRTHLWGKSSQFLHHFNKISQLLSDRRFNIRNVIIAYFFNSLQHRELINVSSIRQLLQRLWKRNNYHFFYSDEEHWHFPSLQYLAQGHWLLEGKQSRTQDYQSIASRPIALWSCKEVYLVEPPSKQGCLPPSVRKIYVHPTNGLVCLPSGKHFQVCATRPWIVLRVGQIRAARVQ